ncbi:hypothetical protein GCM10009715_29580 [Paeniglutamicibacter psychrophenolicus]|uniref:DUF4190 domain-containing protein n=1 Tax=Paeniglutamicibacter psychrophenolicus TaxID=257454 RepID=A0ABS4W8L5_9MICC|nr:DUF4190 domain-containing protein [Paeniglutamicibacter psychrophenolicus]MBP2372542.1 hypothetical protein [Paeniglutamicibacter psychrophenolicus]
MATHEQGPNEPDAGPSFDDPRDPRWSQNPHAAPPRNPYQQMPLDAPPIAGGPDGRGYGFAGQGNRPGQNEAWSRGQPPQGWQQPGYPVQEASRSRKLAVVSLVAAIIGFFTFGMFLIPQVVAIACGHLSLRREPHARPIAVFGLVIGYMMLGMRVIVIIFGYMIIGRVPGA